MNAISKPRRRERLARILLLVLLPLSLLLTVGLRAFVVQAYKTPSGSMYPTLEAGDHLFVAMSAYGVFEKTMPPRGDVLTFDFPESLEVGHQVFVKRVIGLPGDTLLVEGGHPTINGWRVPSCLVGRVTVEHTPGSRTELELFVEFLDGAAYVVAVDPLLSHGREGPFVVPKGEVYVLGDNRMNSSDSRVWHGGRGGGVPLGLVGGRGFVVWWPRLASLRGTPKLPAIAPPPDAALDACLAKRPPLERTRPPAPKPG
ncbi:MAG TPA: signal peptidase I [Polyangiaceae bacterium]